jgi:hypothetical protein
MFPKCESRACICCRFTSILPAVNAYAKLDAVPCHLRKFLSLGDVLRLQSFPVLRHLVGDLLALFEGPETGTLYVGIVDENVPAPVVRGDEAVALLLVELP